jgi:hypothetical protein
MRGVLQPKIGCRAAGQVLYRTRVYRALSNQKKMKESIIVTYLSNKPSVSPTLPGPANTIQCSIEARPESQGMRKSSSTICDAQLHTFMLTMGLRANGRLTAGCAVCCECNWRVTSPGDRLLTPGIDLIGKDEDLARPMTMARIAVHAKMAY